MDVVFVVMGIFVGSFSGVEAFVEFQVYKLGEFGRVYFVLVRFFFRVKSQVGFEIVGVVESFVVNLYMGKRGKGGRWEDQKIKRC